MLIGSNVSGGASSGIGSRPPWKLTTAAKPRLYLAKSKTHNPPKQYPIAQIYDWDNIYKSRFVWSYFVRVDEIQRFHIVQGCYKAALQQRPIFTIRFHQRKILFTSRSSSALPVDIRGKSKKPQLNFSLISEELYFGQLRGSFFLEIRDSGERMKYNNCG